jgi:hypothetical protein
MKQTLILILDCTQILKQTMCWLQVYKQVPPYVYMGLTELCFYNKP